MPLAAVTTIIGWLEQTRCILISALAPTGIFRGFRRLLRLRVNLGRGWLQCELESCCETPRLEGGAPHAREPGALSSKTMPTHAKGALSHDTGSPDRARDRGLRD